jgi:hypothetical protein
MITRVVSSRGLVCSRRHRIVICGRLVNCKKLYSLYLFIREVDTIYKAECLPWYCHGRRSGQSRGSGRRVVVSWPGFGELGHGGSPSSATSSCVWVRVSALPLDGYGTTLHCNA